MVVDSNNPSCRSRVGSEIYGPVLKEHFFGVSASSSMSYEHTFKLSMGRVNPIIYLFSWTRSREFIKLLVCAVAYITILVGVRLGIQQLHLVQQVGHYQRYLWGRKTPTLDKNKHEADVVLFDFFRCPRSCCTLKTLDHVFVGFLLHANYSEPLLGAHMIINSNFKFALSWLSQKKGHCVLLVAVTEAVQRTVKA